MFDQKNRYLICLLSALFIGLSFANLVEAADKKDKGGKRNAQIIQKMRQQQAALQSELEAEKAALAEKDLALQVASKNAIAAGSSLKKIKLSLEQSNSDLEKTKETLLATEAELLLNKNELAEYKSMYQKAVADLAFNDQQRKTQVENIAQTTRRLNDCSEKKQLLYTQGKLLIEIYEKPSLYESVMRNENFFQLKRVELENILQDKLDLIDEAM